MGGFYPRRRYRGGGCLSGMIGTILLPVLFVAMLVIYLIIPGDGGSTWSTTDGYNEEVFQDYADSQYAAEFGASSAYEDNLLITVLIDEESYTNFYYIAWVGDHVAADINQMLGNNSTALGQAMMNCISETSYKYSLDSDLARVVETVTQKIQDLSLESSFSCNENHAQVQSHLTNHTALSMTEDTVNSALTAFTDATGIPVVIVVEDMVDVFGKNESSSASAGLILILILIAVVGIVLLVKWLKKRKKQGDGGDDYQSRYHDFDDAY